jgi:hypothetical protein
LHVRTFGMIPPLFRSQPVPPSPAVGMLVEMEGRKNHGGKGTPAHSQAIKEFAHGCPSYRSMPCP